ncbi:hypothetical protein JXC34_03005 [Candidatus Woesearchaeota archaeon]|nr:hypothetical protein [Candidatus Woesearchaeota archaeon]
MTEYEVKKFLSIKDCNSFFRKNKEMIEKASLDSIPKSSRLIVLIEYKK